MKMQSTLLKFNVIVIWALFISGILDWSIFYIITLSGLGETLALNLNDRYIKLFLGVYLVLFIGFCFLIKKLIFKFNLNSKQLVSFTLIPAIIMIYVLAKTFTYDHHKHEEVHFNFNDSE